MMLPVKKKKEEVLPLRSFTVLFLGSTAGSSFYRSEDDVQVQQLISKWHR